MSENSIVKILYYKTLT